MALTWATSKSLTSLPPPGISLSSLVPLSSSFVFQLEFIALNVALPLGLAQVTSIFLGPGATLMGVSEGSPFPLLNLPLCSELLFQE